MSDGLFFPKKNKKKSKCKHVWVWRETTVKRGRLYDVYACKNCTGTRGNWKV